MGEHAYKNLVIRTCMLGWMCGKICKEKIKSRRIWGHLGTTLVDDNIRGRRLTW